ncbi:MAG TPA: acetyl-CoA hydrolase/transferase C-terminal domain-containing protein, partial [Hyphomicrobiaceae bacterium]|nr:acetyl-CoA hydrolase/transferase C-terminal domain-containing protein [Hyphomicrobiaceae bacterium]
EPLYVAALRRNQLPPNIEVNEFFLQAGAWLTNGPVQRNYTSLNYSQVARHLRRIEINILAQLVAPGTGDRSAHISLGSNTDVTLDLMSYAAARRASGEPVVVAAELNANLPYMPGAAEVERREFDVMLEPEGPAFDLFAPPKEPVSLADYAMALRAATRVKDGGTLQIGIGSFSDALAHALILRHANNAAFCDLLERLGHSPADGDDLGPFQTGLYGCTEMLVDGFLALRRAGILCRRVTNANGTQAVLHAGFFVGSQAFYRELKEMRPEELAEICMTAISFTNTLREDETLKRAQRLHARFINTAMTVTLLGAVSSDALDDGRVVSGPGGQHDLVTMAHDLEGARSIIAVRSTRPQKRRAHSNIVWSYRNATVPRHLRDIVVTEYGVADLRGKSDRDSIAAMLAVADSAYQADLQRQAQAAGKLETSFALPAHASSNRPERLEAALGPARRSGLLPAFPLGTEMTEVEQRLAFVLSNLKTAAPADLVRSFTTGLADWRLAPADRAALERLQLIVPATLTGYALRTLIVGALRRS